MAKVSVTGAAVQAATLPGVADGGTAPGVHPLKRSGRGGPARSEPRWADGLPPLHTSQPPSLTDGLVPSAKTARVVPSTLAGLGNAVVTPTFADVLGAAAAFGSSPWENRNILAGDSPLPRWYITPGALVATRTSARQLVRAGELAHIRHVAAVNVAAPLLAADPGWRPNAIPGREVTSWSAKSRSNMVKTLASLDWGPVHELDESGRVPAMVTLTYPGDWEVVVPDGKTVKRQVRALLWRYRRAWGETVVGAWKLEFQHRGAPHIHIFMAPPHGRAAGRGAGAGLSFRHWLSVVWADIVDHPDPVEYQKHLLAGTGVDVAEALKCTDPKRLARYFSKHGQYCSKEYQHIVPEAWQAPGKGPGRFWGYWGLKPLVVAVELSMDDYLLASRIMRRYASRVRVWDKPSGRWVYVRAMTPAKPLRKDVDVVTGEVVWRRRRRRVRVRRFGQNGSGFLLVNDAPALAHQLARALRVCGGGRQ
jgi:hypothetical protein